MLLHVINRTRLPPSTEMAITSDEKGEDILHLIQMDDNKHDELKVTLYRSDFYIHYPVKRPTLIGFGNQDRSRLGTGKSSGDTLFMNIQVPNRILVKQITARRHFSVLTDTSNQFYICGNVRGCNERKDFQHAILPNEA